MNRHFLLTNLRRAGGLGDQDIKSVNFNRITGVNPSTSARFLQFSLYYRFQYRDRVLAAAFRGLVIGWGHGCEDSHPGI